MSAPVKPPFSIDAVMMGRNDEYEPRWNEKLVASIAHNRRMFEGSRVDYRVTFVEWNPPSDKPLLGPQLVERFPFLRAIVVKPAVHEALCESDQSIMLNFSLNCGLRTSDADFCLISAGDLFIGRQLAAYIRELGLNRNCLYRAERVNIRADLDFETADSETLEDPANAVSVNTCTEPPYDVPPYFHACGDFLLTDRLSMLGIRGFDEGIRFARLHLDSRFCSTAVSAGLHANLIGRIFHISHSNSYTNQLGNYRDRHYGYLRGLPYLNDAEWGLADHDWQRAGERLWIVTRPQADRVIGAIPFTLSEDELAKVNAVTKRIIDAKNAQPPVGPAERAAEYKAIPARRFRVPRQWQGARVLRGGTTRIETVSEPWGYSALLDLRRAFRKWPLDFRALSGGNQGGRNCWFVEVDAEAVEGSVGVGLLTSGNLTNEIILDHKDGRRRLHIGAHGMEEDLLVRNVATTGKSSFALVHGVRILRQPYIAIDEEAALL
jgi:hypothetical protein